MSRTGIYFVVALASAAVGYALYQFVVAPRLEPKAAAGQTPLVMAKEAMTSAAPTASESTLPATLPDVSMPDRDGQMRALDSWSGKSMIINFWATWCAPCRREIPLLNQIQRQQAARGFQVVGIAVDVRDEVLEYTEANTIDYPLLISEERGMEAASKLGQGSLALPLTAFTDQQHRLVATHAGELTQPQADAILEVIDRLNRGELTLESARSLAEEKLQAVEG
jgi:thiol-disulfide isomerase/thioredoxin